MAKEYINEIVSNWQNALMKEGIINSNPYTMGNPIKILKKNQNLIGTLRGLTQEASWQAMSYKILYESGEQLADLIENEINNM